MAATTESFNAVLKRYTPWEMYMEELKKHDWFINWVPKKTDWMGGTMEIPFKAASASSFQWGALTAENDISQDEYLMGTLTNSDLKELWGTQKFNQKDLKRHGSLKASYLKLLYEQTPEFVGKMKEKVSVTYFGDGSIDALTATGANGSIQVNYPHRFEIGEKIIIDDGDSSPATAYVTAININTKTLTIKDARTGGSNVDATGFTVAQGAKVYTPGYGDEGAGLKSILLSASNGGGSSYFGYTKASYPALQARNISGASFTKATLLDDIYDAYYTIVDEGRGSMDKTLVCNIKFLRHISALLENNKRYEMKTTKANIGFREVEILGPDGVAKMVFIRDCDPTTMYVLQKDAIALCGNNFFKRDADANGNEFYVTRGTSGKVNIVDTAFEAALVVRGPSHCGIVHDIPNPLV